MKMSPVLAIALLLAQGFCGAAVAEHAWLGQIGGRGADVARGVTGTSDGRVCATGTFWATAGFGTGEHVISLESSGTQDIFVACYTAAGSLEFARRFGTARGDDPRAIAALPNGDVLVTGLFEDRFGLDEEHALQANGIADIFLTRLDKDGRQVWARQFGGPSADNGNALAVTAAGEILLAGSFQGTMKFPVGDRLAKLNSAAGRDAFVMKLDADGEVLWARRIGGEGFVEASEIIARSDGSIIVAGTFRDSMDTGTGHLSSRGYKDVFLIALDADGKSLWHRHAGGAQQDTVHGLAEDGLGRIHAAGNFQDTIAFPDGSSLKSAGGMDVFLARFAADGDLQRVSSFGGELTDQVFALAPTANGGLVLSGHYQGDSDMAPGPAVAVLSAPTAANSSAFLLALDDQGDYQKAIMLGGGGMEMALGLSVLQDGAIAVVGLFNDDMSALRLDVLENRGKTDVFVARLQRPGVTRASGARIPIRTHLGW